MENLKYNRVLFILFIFLIPFFLSAQSRLGFEIRSSYNKTFNTSSMLGFDQGGISGGVKVLKEGNTYTNSYSFGVLYNVSKSTILKLHFGHHKNGRIFDVRNFNDESSNHLYGVDLPYNYFQITPSISYHLSFRKLRFPMEIGFGINKLIQEDDIFYFYLNEYNYDFRCSLGLSYPIIDNIYIGLNAVFSESLNDYQLPELQGDFRPRMVGVEVGVQYYLLDIFKGKESE